MAHKCEWCGLEYTARRSNQLYCDNTCGNNARSKRFRDKPEYSASRKKYTEQPKYKYAAQKASSKKRGIEFHLTFEEWWGLWEPHWENRGRNQMVMCREEDTGAYEVGNVRIDTHTNNMREWMGLL